MKNLLLITVTMALMLCAGCASDQQVIGQAKQFNDSIEPAVVEQNDDPVLAEYIQRVGDRIIQAAKEYNRDHPDEGKESRDWMFSNRMKFHFVNSKTLNAFTTGGEHMYIYTELFVKTRSEDELAAVMSHEFAHVYMRHVQRGMNRQMAIMGGAAAAGAAGYAVGGSEKGGEYAGMAAGLAGTALQFVGMNYTRKDEAQADEYGFQFYTRAGWDPDRFGDFFKHMIDMGLDTGSEYLSDHPSLKSRYELAQQRAKNLPASAEKWQREPVAAGAEYRRLQDRAASVADKMPDDKSLQQTQKLLQALPRSCLTPAIQPDQKRAEEQILAAAERHRKRARE